MKTLTLACFLSLFCLQALRAQTADAAAWDASSNPPQTARLQVWRGDTLPLAPRWGADTNGWNFTAYWSTNNAAWWSKSLSAGSFDIVGDPFLWTPDMDTGAAKYRLFIRASNAGGASYRANAEIFMLDSPGVNPSQLPPPDAYAALASDVLPLMLPYLPTYDAWTAEAAERAAADLALQQQLDDLAAFGSGTAAAATLRDTADSNMWWQAFGGTNLTAFRAVQGLVTNPNVIVATHETFGGDFVRRADMPAQWTNVNAWSYIYVTDKARLYTVGGVERYVGDSTVPPYQFTVITGGTAPLPATAFKTAAGTLTNTVASHNLGAPVAGGSDSNALALASNAWLRAGVALSDAAAASNSVVSATNRIVQTYLVGTNAWITVDFSNATISVSMIVAGHTNTVTAGEAADAIDPAATNELWQALASGLAAKADKAWGKYTPDGGNNPDPAYMTWLNAPATLLASGASWSTYGTYAVISSTGTVAFATGGDGALHVGPDSTNWFGYVTGGSVLVGAVPASLTVTGGGTPEGTAQIVYPYAGGDFPVLWFTPSLAVDFTELSGAVWADNLNGTATVTAPATAAAGFYKATTAVSISSVFESTMPARLSGGVFGATTTTPVVYDATITITSGGNTYRIPAQLVD